MLPLAKALHGAVALLRRYARRQAVPHVDRHREGRPERGIVRGHHGREMEPARLLARHRRADDAAAVPDDESHLLGRAKRGRTDEVAFVLPVVVIRHDDDLAARDRLDGLVDIVLMVHRIGSIGRSIRR